MDSKKLFDKYYSRLAREGMLKALLCGIVIGFAVDFVVALVTWLIPGLDFGFAIALGAGIIVGVIAAIIFYHKAFKPTTKKIARRIDSLGLEERLITMTELENDESYIAMRQREDAKAKLNEVNSKSIKFVIARSLIIAAVVVGVLGLSMTTVNALAGTGVIPDPNPFIPDDVRDQTVMVSYIVDNDEAGWIDGDTDQVIYVGDKTTEVTAIANEGWAFVEWEEDKSTNPARFDSNITGDMVFTAVFVELSDGNGSNGDGDKDPGDVEPDNEPSNKDNSDIPPEGPPSNEPPTENKPGDQDVKYLPSNQIKDGKTPYQNDFEDDYNAAMEKLLSDGNLTAEEKAMLEEYFRQLKAGAGNIESSDDNPV